MGKKTKTIHVNYLARVEGEGALYVNIEEGKVKEVQLKIFEPPRFFEALLRGRDFKEAPDITARICGICPVAYQMSAVHAMENALGIKVPDQLAALRRLIYCGEWIESHTLHIYMLHAPDFLGFPDAIKMAQKYPEEVKRGLRIKKAGNSIVALMGGREIHPINVKVGGFYKLPEKRDLEKLAEELKKARDEAIETVRWVSAFNFPDVENDYEFVSLVHPEHYPQDIGTIRSNKGLDIEAKKFDQCIEEYQVEYSNALQSRIKGRGAYLAGPMARYALNYDRLSEIVKQTANSVGFPKVCNNPYKSIIVRALEVLYAIDEAIRVINQYERPAVAAVPVSAKAGIGFGCTEAPRGLLYHRYEMDRDGLIQNAQIVPPTSQNQKMIEEDICRYLKSNLDQTEKKLTEKCEQLIRNYDPCISCSAHFLNIKFKNS